MSYLYYIIYCFSTAFNREQSKKQSTLYHLKSWFLFSISVLALSITFFLLFSDIFIGPEERSSHRDIGGVIFFTIDLFSFLLPFVYLFLLKKNEEIVSNYSSLRAKSFDNDSALGLIYFIVAIGSVPIYIFGANYIKTFFK